MGCALISAASPEPPHSMRLDACRTCQECGSSFAALRDHGAFCGVACRKAFNNRRAMRGAFFYDLYMHFRFARPEARRLNVFAALNRLASVFRAEDVAARAGRVSWQSPAVVFDRYPYIVVRRGRP